MKSKRLVQWFGSNTENAAAVGRLLEGCRFVGIPFAGGMSEVPFITAKQILANDLHRMVVNLCCVIQDDSKRQWLIQQADGMPYHPDVLETAQRKAREFAAKMEAGETIRSDHEAALAYFVSVWMGRGGKAGTTGELDGALPIRWNANGGGSNRRYRTAIEALDAWGETFRRCEFTCLDGLEFVQKFKDEAGHGLYVDAPWPDAGEEYQHKFTEAQQRRLAELLVGFNSACVVVRFGEHPLIRWLYPEPDWTWLSGESRDQANAVKAEWLIGRNLER
jgi:site-specific DNA-adenine methylase